MNKRLVHSIDGKRVSKKSFLEVCKSRKNRHTVIGDKALGNHIFSTYEHFDNFLRNQPATASSHLANLRKDEVRERLVEKLGRRKAMAFHSRKNKLLKNINSLVEQFLDEAGADAPENEIALMQSVVSPKMGSVAFYADPNFRNRFALYEGLNHIDMQVLDSEWDNALSSIWLWGYYYYSPTLYYCSPPPTLRLYDEPCFGGDSEASATITFYFNTSYQTSYWTYDDLRFFSQHKIENLAWYGWDNRVSSWKFL